MSCRPPLCFDTPVLRYTFEEDRFIQDIIHSGPDSDGLLGDSGFRHALWSLAADAMTFRRVDRPGARELVGLVREAWEAYALGRIDAGLTYYFAAVNHSTMLQAELLWRSRQSYASRQSERARKPRNKVSDQDLQAHRQAYCRKYGTAHGWQKRAAIELEMTERAIRSRLKKIRK